MMDLVIDDALKKQSLVKVHTTKELYELLRNGSKK